MDRQSSSIEEDYIIVAPTEAGEQPQEYCVQDDSRPKLFGIWGPLIPIGKAASAFLSSFLDSRNSSGSNGSYMTNVTVDPVSDTRHDVATVDGSHACVQDTTDSDEENTYKSDLHAIRRKSMKKQRAFSSSCDLDSEYALQKFKLNSKDNSTDDYLILKVKTRSTSSLCSLQTPSTEAYSLADGTNREHSVGNGHALISAENASGSVERDSPAFPQHRKYSDKPVSSNPGSGLLLRKQMNDKKSHSLPSKTELVSLDSFVPIVTNSLPVGTGAGPILPSNGTVKPTVTSNGAGPKQRVPSEEEIKDTIKCHCDHFVQYSNWTTLLPLLEASSLLDPETREKLMNCYIGDREKGLYFYLKTLPSQGRLAYTKFYHCLMKEKEHSGHKTLQEYFAPHLVANYS